MVTADDGSGEANATASITVTIEVKDLDEKPEVVESGLAISGGTDFRYPEGGMDVVDTYMAIAYGPDAAMATLTLGGDDAGDFTFEGGVLSFRNSPDYENPVDENTDNIYMVTVNASDGTNTATPREVVVTVTNIDETGTVTLSTARPNRGTPVTATVDDPDGWGNRREVAVGQVHGHDCLGEHRWG